MTESLSSADRTQIAAVVTALEAAWNAGDGVAYAAPMTSRHSAMFSAVLTREAEGWRIASSHNTLAPPAGR